MSSDIQIYLSTGFYFGFVRNEFLYSRDGICLGWVDESNFVWDLKGRFRGSISKSNDHAYIIRKRFGLPPISRPPKDSIPSVIPPPPPANIEPVAWGVEVIDAFEL